MFTFINQKGIAPIALIIIFAALILIGGGIYWYKAQQVSIVPEIVEPTPTPQSSAALASSTPKPISKSNGIPIQVTTTISTPKPSSSSAPNSAVTVPEVLINAAGSYTYSGQEIKYAISFPKNGGAVAGGISGICNGPIIGTFSGGDGGVIKSNVDAKCQIGILSQDLKADFEGKVYFTKGQADLEWQGSIPFYSGSKEFSLSFTPL